MPHTHHIIFLLLFITGKTTPNSDLDNSSSCNLETPEKTTVNEGLNKSFHQKKNPKIFTEKEVAEMEFIFKKSPEKSQRIVNYLANPINSSSNEDCRLAIFFGDSESGNKEMAQIIAYKMYQQGWNIEFFSSKSLFGKNSDHTAIKLANKLNSIETLNEPTIIIFFDLNQLLEYNFSHYSSSKSRSPKENSSFPELTNTVFWNFLNRQKSNEKFFLIGTMDDIQKLPQYTKNKIIMNVIEFPSHP